MPATGPDFISLQARDLDASQAFYEHYLGLVRSPTGPAHAVPVERFVGPMLAQMGNIFLLAHRHHRLEHG